MVADPRDEAVHEVTYTKLAEEKINLMKRDILIDLIDGQFLLLSI